MTVIRHSLAEGVAALSEATDWLLATFPGNMKAASAGAVPFLKLFGTVAGGWQMARAALISKNKLDENSDDYDFYRAKIGTARFYAEHVLPLATAFKQEIVHGSGSVLALEEASSDATRQSAMGGKTQPARLRLFFPGSQFSVDKLSPPDDDSNVRLNHLFDCFQGGRPENAGTCM